MGGWISEAHVFKMDEYIRRLYSGILATRPYSWANAVLIGLGAHLLVVGNLALSHDLLTTVAVSLTMWVAGLTGLEYFHKKFEYEESVTYHVLPLPFILLLAISLTQTIKSVVILCVFLIGLLLYSGKVLGYFAEISFLFRGISEVTLIWLVYSFHGAFVPNTGQLLYIGIIYTLTASRNVIGDIRDREVDDYTLAVNHPWIAVSVSLSLGIISIILISDILVAVPVVTVLLLIAFRGVENAGQSHRIYVIATTFLLLNIIIEQQYPSFLFIASIVFVSVLLNFTYWEVPRKQDKLATEN